MENEYHFEQIEKAIAYIWRRRSDQPNLDEIAAHVHMSKFHFQRVFKKWAGISPKDFLQYLTLEQAKKSLKNGKSTLEAAFDAGLSGNGRLHDLFVKIEACTPGEYRKKGADLEFRVAAFSSPFGQMSVAESQRGISKISFNSEKNLTSELRKEFPHAQISQGLGPNGIKTQNYLNNWKFPDSPIELDIWGSGFQIQVWKALLQIPSSQLLSYGDDATLVNNPKASRAVGSAIGTNPVAYLIPCHRVIKSTGETGNYRWGTPRKMAINGYESAILSN